MNSTSQFTKRVYMVSLFEW